MGSLLRPYDKYTAALLCYIGTRELAMKDIGKVRLRRKLESLAKDMGASYFGIGDLTSARQSITEQGGGFLAQFPRAVYHGFALIDGIVNTLDNRQNIAARHNHWDYVYRIANPRLDSISAMLAQYLEQAGFQGFVVPSSQPTDRAQLAGVFSHKLAAHLAGLDWQECPAHHVGARPPRDVWGTVLTDAPFEAGLPMDEMCSDCCECVDACPARAFTGQAFDKPKRRREIFAAEACYRYLREKETFRRVCGTCVYICPLGRNK